MQKKVFLLGLVVSAATFFSLGGLTKATMALNLGVSVEEDYKGALNIGGRGVTIRAGAKSSLVVEYENDRNLDKIELKLQPAEGLKIVSNNLVGRTGDELTGSGGNYAIKINKTVTEPNRGEAVIGVQMPMPTATSEYSMEVEAVAYNESGEKIDQKKLVLSYLVLVKNTNCNADTRVKIRTVAHYVFEDTVVHSAHDAVAEIDTNAGKPVKYVGEAPGTAYTLDTTAESMDLILTPDNEKAAVIYMPELSSLTNGQELVGGKLTGAKLEYGENNFLFVVQSECAKDWTETTAKINQRPITVGIEDWSEYEYGPELYIILVNREDNRSKVNTLSRLTVSDGKIDFRPEVKNYTVKVGHEVDTLKINSSLSDEKSTYAEGGDERVIKLHDGENEISIRVRAENGEEAVYTIKVVREASDNAKLAKLSVNGKELDLKDDKLIYTVRVENEVATVKLSAEAKDAQARLELNEDTELREGENILEIKVTAASGAQNVYTIKVVRDKLISENSKLKLIEIENHEIAFESEKYDYDVELKAGEKKLIIKVETENVGASYKIIGNEKLKNGATIEIEVTAQDGKTVSNYFIHVRTNGNVVGLVLLSVGIVLGVVIIVILVVLAKKDKRKLDDKREADEDEVETEEERVRREKEEGNERAERENEAWEDNNVPKENDDRAEEVDVGEDREIEEIIQDEKASQERARQEEIARARLVEAARLAEKAKLEREKQLRNEATATLATPQRHKIRARRKNRA